MSDSNPTAAPTMATGWAGDPQVSTNPADWSEPAEAPPEGPDLSAGQLVTHTYFDCYAGAGGEDVTLTGIVVAVDENGAASVAWLTGTDPIPAHQLALA